MVERRQFWRRTTNVITLGAAVVAGTLALGVLFFAVHWAELQATEVASKRYLAALSLVAGILLVLAVFCLGMLGVRLILRRARPLGKPFGPTEHVNAWEIAGQRFRLEEQDEDEKPDAADDR